MVPQASAVPPCRAAGTVDGAIAMIIAAAAATAPSHAAPGLTPVPVITAAAMAATASIPPYNATVSGRILPMSRELLVRLAKEGRALSLDGVPVFNGDDKFLPGKIALGLAEFLVSVPADDPRRAEYLAGFRRISKLTVDDANDSWGIYYYMSGLNKLRKAGMLSAAVDRLTLAKLRVRLDWRSFVDVDTFTLIDHPNNYYCVAFGIARLRVQMGWEEAAGSERLLQKMLEHYRQFSGEHGFADETDGDGRFDRYSVLLSAEIAQKFIETGAQPPAEVIGWVRKSADVMLQRLNLNGDGFEYGRSLGPYGLTAMIEVLTAAAVLGVLNEQEKALAYAFISRAGQHYVEFWLNPKTGSVDMWDQGRRTDAYRGKFRILGENLSLAHQFVYTNAFWNQLGFQDRPPMPDFAAALQHLPKRTVTWFARGEYDRMLLTLRDRGHVLGLPLINGGTSQHMHNPYFPIPYSPGMLDSVADGSAPQLIPQLTLADGAVLAPLAYFQHVSVLERTHRTVITFQQPQLDKLGTESPVADDRFSLTSTYTLEPGRITRSDVYTPRSAVPLKSVRIEFATYSDQPVLRGTTTTFGRGAVRKFSAFGFERCDVAPVQDDVAYHTPTGPFATRVVCENPSRTLQGPLRLGWTLSYQ
ncbi:MAG TPA: hypothetical protein VNO35_18455 [Steroidobacteraceae bacterium]|nr:hypothetical protein [Steroidobacteraceae bacterium]